MTELPFYISKEDLLKLIEMYENDKPPGTENKEFKGFTFRLGTNNGEDALFPDALYSSGQRIGDERFDAVIENNSTGVGCPYPPGYPPAMNNEA